MIYTFQKRFITILFSLLVFVACSDKPGNNESANKQPQGKSAAHQIVVSDAYVRETPPGTKNSALFMTLKNADNKLHEIITVESSVAQTLELHTHANDNGVMKMLQVNTIPLRANYATQLKPGSFHVMLINLKHNLIEGEKIQFLITFEDNSKIKFNAPVRKINVKP